ncbi:unnamed protein product, partial [Nesidiocoris tenuis]
MAHLNIQKSADNGREHVRAIPVFGIKRNRKRVSNAGVSSRSAGHGHVPGGRVGHRVSPVGRVPAAIRFCACPRIITAFVERLEMTSSQIVTWVVQVNGA